MLGMAPAAIGMMHNRVAETPSILIFTQNERLLKLQQVLEPDRKNQGLRYKSHRMRRSMGISGEHSRGDIRSSLPFIEEMTRLVSLHYTQRLDCERKPCVPDLWNAGGRSMVPVARLACERKDMQSASLRPSHVAVIDHS